MTIVVLELINKQLKGIRHQSFDNQQFSDKKMSCKKMNISKLRIKNKKPIFLAMFLFAMIMGAVVAQLLSNRIDQMIVIRGEDESYLLTVSAPFAGSEWVGTAVAGAIKIEQIRVLPGTMHIQIENLDNTSFLISNVELKVGYRYADNSPFANPVVKTLVQLNSTIVEFSEPVWMGAGETASYYVLVITWFTTAPGGNYQVSVFID